MSILGYHHVALVVQDADRSVAFYVDGLGGEVTARFPMGSTGKEILLVTIGPGAVIELLPRGDGVPEANARWAHIALATDDAKAGFELALKAGAKEQSPPREMQLAGIQVRNAFVTGPDGEVIEFFEIL